MKLEDPSGTSEEDEEIFLKFHIPAFYPRYW